MPRVPWFIPRVRVGVSVAYHQGEPGTCHGLVPLGAPGDAWEWLSMAVTAPSSWEPRRGQKRLRVPLQMNSFVPFKPRGDDREGPSETDW